MRLSRAFAGLEAAMALQWTEALALGVPEIDRQHQELFRRVESLVEAVLHKDRTEVVRLVAFLDEYVIAHFGAEEELMRSRRYPGYAVHKAEHDRFLADLSELDRDLRATGPTQRLTTRIHRQVCDWLRDHIYLTDTSLGHWLKRV